jgi:activator of 2-hydroxyglutaryl-CoA dehydratase
MQTRSRPDLTNLRDNRRWYEKASNDRRFVDSFNRIYALDSAIRRTALKKHTTSVSTPAKQKRPTACKKTTTKLTVGIDLGDQKSSYCILDTEGDVISEGAVQTSESAFAQQFQNLRPCRIALETGRHSP